MDAKWQPSMRRAHVRHCSAVSENFVTRPEPPRGRQKVYHIADQEVGGQEPDEAKEEESADPTAVERVRSGTETLLPTPQPRTFETSNLQTVKGSKAG